MRAALSSSRFFHFQLLEITLRKLLKCTRASLFDFDYVHAVVAHVATFSFVCDQRSRWLPPLKIKIEVAEIEPAGSRE